ncbi:MAG: lasso peptide [Akkermansiaceae bacterium]|nr:lasso peptide [Verrucomicrobiales bacterium]
MNEKKTYSAPVLTVHGDVEDITQQCHFANRDLPSGNAPSAFPASGPCS